MWRYEADLYASDAGKLLPPGLRLPLVYSVLDLGDDGSPLVLEEVAVTRI